MFKVGQDVIVTFDGEDYPGEVLEVARGWVTARICVDPLADHGELLTPMLGPRTIVNVRESFVQLQGDND